MNPKESSSQSQTEGGEDLVDTLVQEVSIDGMCGVY